MDVVNLDSQQLIWRPVGADIERNGSRVFTSEVGQGVVSSWNLMLVGAGWNAQELSIDTTATRRGFFGK